MTTDKAKQMVALIGGFLSSLVMFFGIIGFQLEWFNEVFVEGFVGVLLALIPLAFGMYGVYKNSFIMTEKAREQEDELIRKGLK